MHKAQDRDFNFSKIIFFTQSENTDVLPYLFILIGGIFFQKILSLQINPSSILAPILCFTHTQDCTNILNLTKNLITGPNNTFSPSFTLLLRGQPCHEFTCIFLFFTVSFIFLAPGDFSFFPIRSTMHFVFFDIV